MKKLLITISPFCVALCIVIWIVQGLKGMLIFFSAVLFFVIFMFGFIKWMNFVDKHIKD